MDLYSFWSVFFARVRQSVTASAIAEYKSVTAESRTSEASEVKTILPMTAKSKNAEPRTAA